MRKFVERGVFNPGRGKARIRLRSDDQIVIRERWQRYPPTSVSELARRLRKSPQAVLKQLDVLRDKLRAIDVNVLFEDQLTKLRDVNGPSFPGEAPLKFFDDYEFTTGARAHGENAWRADDTEPEKAA